MSTCEEDFCTVLKKERKTMPHAYMVSTGTGKHTGHHWLQGIVVTERNFRREYYYCTLYDKIQSKWVVSIPPKLANFHSKEKFLKGFHFLIQIYAYRYSVPHRKNRSYIYWKSSHNIRALFSIAQMRWTLCVTQKHRRRRHDRSYIH